ncbi:MAG: hypothetical protein ACOYOJ_15040, partial [Alsobacter sp.]
RDQASTVITEASEAEASIDDLSIGTWHLADLSARMRVLGAPLDHTSGSSGRHRLESVIKLFAINLTSH